MQSSAPYRPPLPRRPAAATSDTPAADRCPFLGTAADPDVSLAFPSDANHCFRSRFPVPLSSIHQESFCLTEQYTTCPVYRQFAEKDATPVAPVIVAGVASGEGVTKPLPPAGSRGDSSGSAAAPALAADAAMAVAAAPPAVVPSLPSFPSPVAPPPPSFPAPVAPPPPSFPASVAPPPAPSIFPPDALAEPDFPDFPDFQPDFGPEPEPQPARRAGVNGRVVLAGLLLLGLLALAGWLWLNYLGSRGGERAASGTVVSLPTLAATADLSTVQAGIAVGSAAEQTATALAATVLNGLVLQPTPTAAGVPAAGDDAAATTSAELDGIAATATALFVGAAPTRECGAPEWWVAYVVQEGDTLEALAAARGILPEEIIVANCLTGPDLAPGQQLALPPIGVIVLLPGLATPTPAATATRPAGFPTRRPGPFPTATFPIVIILPTHQPPVVESTEAPTREASEPPTRVAPTPTQPGARPSATPPVFATPTPSNPAATATPPSFATAQPTRTPPGGEVTPTGTATVSATLTPPRP